MIIAAADGRVRFVTQPDHAALAGQFADRWGNEEFERPTPRPAVANAAYNHDVGWWEYDRGPRLDEDGSPLGFRDVPAESWIDLYDRGISVVAELDPYAGLLASMHGSGLRRRRYGLSPSWPPPQPAFAGFIEREESRQRQLFARVTDMDRYRRFAEDDAPLLDSLHESGQPPNGLESRLWHNYRLLQAWDVLSLLFCETMSISTPRTIEAVPPAPGVSGRSIQLERCGENEFSVDPFPFDTSPVEFTIPARTLRRATIEARRDLVSAYYGTEQGAIELVLRRRVDEAGPRLG